RCKKFRSGCAEAKRTPITWAEALQICSRPYRRCSSRLAEAVPMSWTSEKLRIAFS
ncbi:unnamed protein product, partial [Effrenium voratum]